MPKGRQLPIPNSDVVWKYFRLKPNEVHFNEDIIIEGQLETLQENHIDLKIWYVPAGVSGGPKPPPRPPSRILIDYIDTSLYEDNGIVTFEEHYKLDNKHDIGNYEVEGFYALAPAPQNPLRFKLVP